MTCSMSRVPTGLACGLIAASLVATPVLAQSLPDWQPRDICANDSANGQCLLFEQRAKNDVTASWSVLPETVQRTCLARFEPPLEPSWRILGDCIEIEGRRAQQVRFEAQRKREEEALTQLASSRSKAPAQQSASKPVDEKPSAATDGDDQKRITEEEASFMALLAEQRKADRQAKAAEAAAQAARAAEAERKRVAAEEASFMALLAAQQRADAASRKQAQADKERAEKAKREVEKARIAAEAQRAEAERRRVDQEEASFMARLEAQRRADAEAAKRKSDAAKAARQRAARSCETRLKQVQSSGVIQFALNSAALAGPSATALLDRLASAAAECEGKLSIRVEGHTDSRGSASNNTRLSQARAQTVADYLQSKGVAANRISAKGFGSSKPIASNRTPAGRAKNRRIEFKVN